MPWNVLPDLGPGTYMTATHADQLRENIEWLGALRIGNTTMANVTAAYSIGGGWNATAAISQTMTGSYVKVNFATERFDTFSAYDTSTSRFTVTAAGLYMVGVQFNCSAGALDVAAIYKNGSSWLPIGATGSYGRGLMTTVMSLAVSDFVEFWANGSGACTIGSVGTEFWGVKVG
jgi:hypothetical protein